MKCFFSLAVVLLSGVSAGLAQVPVSREPRHHNIFENEWVRVLDVHIPPGDTSLMHEHGTPSVFVILTSTRMGSQVITEPAKIQLTPGNIQFEGFYTTHRVHRVWNSDTTGFHAMDIELPNTSYRPIDAPLNMKSFSLLFDEKPVRGYRGTLASREALHIPPRKAPVLLVALGDAAGQVIVNHKAFEKKGDFIFLPPGVEIYVTSNSGLKKGLALFELK